MNVWGRRGEVKHNNAYWDIACLHTHIQQSIPFSPHTDKERRARRLCVCSNQHPTLSAKPSSYTLSCKSHNNFHIERTPPRFLGFIGRQQRHPMGTTSSAVCFSVLSQSVALFFCGVMLLSPFYFGALVQGVEAKRFLFEEKSNRSGFLRISAGDNWIPIIWICLGIEFIPIIPIIWII